jgi:putative chitinase
MIPLTVESIMAATGAKRPQAALYLPFLQGTCKAYDITSPRRIAGFLSQIGQESAGLSIVRESLNYSAEGLMQTFGRHRISAADARRYGRTEGRAADQQALANLLYGGDWGRKNLGNTEPGDGWRFVGRGLKQLTGRHNYTECGKALGEDFLTDPDRLLMPINAALSAGWFWSVNGLNKLADAGDVRAMTRKINGGLLGLVNRQALYTQGIGALA